MIVAVLEPPFCFGVGAVSGAVEVLGVTGVGAGLASGFGVVGVGSGAPWGRGLKSHEDCQGLRRGFDRDHFCHCLKAWLRDREGDHAGLNANDSQALLGGRT